VSRRYEFLEHGAELLTGDDLYDISDDWLPGEIESTVALVIGNPYATAGVLHGTRGDIAAVLCGWLALVEDAPRADPVKKGEL